MIMTNKINDSNINESIDKPEVEAVNVDPIDDALAKADITDMNDVMFRAFNAQSKNRNNNGLINN